MIHIYTDGSSRGNPGNGGYAVIILKDNKLIYKYSKQEYNVTNNQMELKAIIHAFELAQTKYPNEICLVHSDSQYCVSACNEWIKNWAQNGWTNSRKKTVENIGLMKTLYKYLTIDFFNCQVIKTKAHTGIVENELADALATNDLAKFNKIIKENNIELEK